MALPMVHHASYYERLRRPGIPLKNSASDSAAPDGFVPHNELSHNCRSPKDGFMLRKAASMLLPAFVLAVMSLASFGQTTATAPTNVTFSSQLYTTGPLPAGVVSGDFNNDGKPDLAVIDNQSNQVSILLGTGGGLFTLGSSTPTGVGPVQIVTGTFTLNGKQHLAVANSDKTITILVGPGDGTFLAQSIPTQGD